MKPKEIIGLFDEYLSERKTHFQAICIGGTALALLGIISRETQDCDILLPEIPGNIKMFSEEFAKSISQSGVFLKNDWLNNGPASLVRDLPADWKNRLQLVFKGNAITLHTLGRDDLLKSKLFALCDRAVDRSDCIELRPTRKELLETLPWLEMRDGNPLWPDHVKRTLTNLAKNLGYEL